MKPFIASPVEYTDMDLVFLGRNDVGSRIYDWLCDRDGVDVLGMVTEKDQLDLVEQLEPTMLVSVGYNHLVPGQVLSIPERGAVNLHPAYLPHNRGKSPNVWSIVDDTPAGATLHYMDLSFDTGDIIARQRVETSFADTGKDLHRRLETAQMELFKDNWPMIETDEVKKRPQLPDAGTYHSIADFRDLCGIDPDATVRAKELLDRLRALTFPPFENAYVELDDERYYLDLEITPASEADGATPEGHLTAYDE